MEITRKTKQAIYIIVYIILLAFVGWYLYYLVSPAPTCTDTKQNQNEKGIDCGGPCKPCQAQQEVQNLKIVEKAIADGGSGTTDVVFKVQNPNTISGSSAFEYTVSLKDGSGNIISQRSGSTYILPADTRYVTEMGLKPEGDVIAVDVDVEITNVQWKELENFGKPQLSIYRKKFAHADSGVGNIVEAVVRNESSYDLNTVNLVIIVRDKFKKIIGINVSKKDILRAREEQSFRVTWPYDFKGDVSGVDIEAQSNMFDEANVAKTSTTPISLPEAQ